ncbi:hypothetical protein SESBI_28918 [Sesbania bispinosa]|nr:hypothetical protein SESBI_28918 [Sesbania bispinosa]
MEFPVQAATNDEANGPKKNQEFQDSSQSKEKEVDPANTTTVSTITSDSVNQSSDDIGAYGPWMLVKRVPRKKQQGKIGSGSGSRQQDSYQPNSELGTRYSLLQQTETPNADQIQKIPTTEELPNRAGPSTVAKIRDPKAGKNPQRYQDKRKTQGKSVQKVSTNKSKAGNSSTTNLKPSSSTPISGVSAGPKQKSNGPDLELKRQKEQEILQVMRYMDKDKGGRRDLAILQTDYINALSSNYPEPKPPDKTSGGCKPNQSTISDNEMKECISMQAVAECNTQSTNEH